MRITFAAAYAAVPVYTYEVVNVYPHDAAAFTQGVAYADGFLYEGTGRAGASSLRRVIPETGEVVRRRDLPDEYFGEGVAVRGERVIQLTWRNGVGFIYDRATLAPAGEFAYAGEGWGLACDGARLIMSDGSSRLYFLNAETFELERTVEVKADGKPVKGLNELEWVEGAIYANVYKTDRLAVIAPDTGEVTAWVDLKGLLTKEERARADCLNGVAYDAAGGRLFVTGKLWPKVFEIRVVEK